MINIDDRLIKETLPKIKPNGLAVLLAISIHLNKESGTCFPSHDRLMKLTGLGSDSVYNALSVLKKEGLLVSSQAIDSKNKTFSRRTFRIETDFIGVFVTAKNAAPLPEPLRDLPDTATPDAVEPDAANNETYLINELERLNEVEQPNNNKPAAAEILIRSTTEFEDVTLVEKLDLKEEKKESPKVALKGSYSDPAPRRFDPFDIEHATDEMISDYRCFEMFKTESAWSGATLTAFADTAREFTKKQNATENTYPNRTEFRKHFFNFVRRKAEIARNGQRVIPGASSTNQSTKANLNRFGGDASKYQETPLF